MIDSDSLRQDEANNIPKRFEEALLSLRQPSQPRGLILDEMPGPKRIAPYSAALTAQTVRTAGGTPIGTGRFVILHDPAGQAGWDGDFRIVVLVRVRLDNEMRHDPALGGAAWSWLTESLENCGAGYHALVGTVTQVLSESFGGLDLSDACGHAEIRASWSPSTADLGPHLSSWYELILMASGHPLAEVHPLNLAGVNR